VLTDFDPAAVRNMAYNARRGAAAAGAAGAGTVGGTAGMAAGTGISSSAIASRCTAAVLDWDADEPLLPTLRATLARLDSAEEEEGEERCTSGKQSEEDDEEEGEEGVGSHHRRHSHRSRGFEVILGADVVHEEGMVGGGATSKQPVQLEPEFNGKTLSNLDKQKCLDNPPLML
jgi:hypothetical protein